MFFHPFPGRDAPGGGTDFILAGPLRYVNGQVPDPVINLLSLAFGVSQSVIAKIGPAGVFPGQAAPGSMV